MLVEESIIDQAIEELELLHNEPEEIVDEIKESYPVIFAYLLSESFELLTEQENEEVFYIASVILKAIELADIEIPETTTEELENIEERNWEILSNSKDNAFRHRISVFFEGYKEEDLLAFVEDMLSDDEDTTITKEGRETIFVSLKTIIDALLILN
jgi:hypothetical protein